MIGQCNELTRKLREQLVPKAALIAYATDEKDSHYLEIRDIDRHGNMGTGRPVTVEFMKGLVREYSEMHSTTPYGKVPSNLLYCDPRKGCERYVWYNPPGRRMMYFVSAL